MIILDEEQDAKIIGFFRHYGYDGNEVRYLYQVIFSILDDGSIDKSCRKYDVIDETSTGKIGYQVENSKFYIKRNKIFRLNRNPIFSNDNTMITLNIVAPNEEFFEKNIESFYEVLESSLFILIERILPSYTSLKSIIEEHQKEVDRIDKLIETVQEIISKKLLTD